jgi:hypothetical protein
MYLKMTVTKCNSYEWHCGSIVRSGDIRYDVICDTCARNQIERDTIISAAKVHPGKWRAKRNDIGTWWYTKYMAQLQDTQTILHISYFFLVVFLNS